MLMSDYSRDRKHISLTKVELRAVFDDLDDALDLQEPVLSKVLTPVSQPPFRSLLLRLAETQEEIDAVDTEYPAVPAQETIIVNESVITTVTAGLDSIPEELAHDICLALGALRIKEGI